MEQPQYPLFIETSCDNSLIKCKAIKNNNSNADRNQINDFDHSQNKRRVYHDIHQSLKDSDNKFGGDDTDDMFENFIIDEGVSKDYELNNEQMFQYLHKLLKKEALRYFNTFVISEEVNYEEAKDMIFRHFVSPDVQNRVKNELQTMRFSDFVKNEGSRPKALQSLATHISNNYIKCPPSQRSEANRVEFFKRALQKENWATYDTLQNRRGNTI